VGWGGVEWSGVGKKKREKKTKKSGKLRGRKIMNYFNLIFFNFNVRLT
jgi:hypothetical protein